MLLLKSEIEKRHLTALIRPGSGFNSQSRYLRSIYHRACSRKKLLGSVKSVPTIGIKKGPILLRVGPFLYL